jgi:hypothetical protein
MGTPHIQTFLTNLALSFCTASDTGGAEFNPLERPLPNLRHYTCDAGFPLGIEAPNDDSDEDEWEEEREPPLLQKLRDWKAAGRVDMLEALPKISLDTLAVNWGRYDDMYSLWSLLVTHPQLNSQLTSLELRHLEDVLPDGIEMVLYGNGSDAVLPSLHRLVVEVSKYNDLLALHPLTQLRSLTMDVIRESDNEMRDGDGNIAFCCEFQKLEHLEYTAMDGASHYLDDDALENLARCVPHLTSFCFAGCITTNELTKFPGEGNGHYMKAADS